MDEPTVPPATVTPRSFFVPAAKDAAEAEDAWQDMHAKAGFVTTDRRVQRISYNNRRGAFTSEVGYLENDEEYDWLTTAIFEPADAADPWMISILRFADETPVWRDPPILVGQSDVLEVIDFLPVA